MYFWLEVVSDLHLIFCFGILIHSIYFEQSTFGVSFHSIVLTILSRAPKLFYDVLFSLSLGQYFVAREISILFGM